MKNKKITGIGVILLILSAGIIVSALTSEEQTALEDELANLTQYLEERGNFLNYDNLMLSIDNKILTSKWKQNLR